MTLDVKISLVVSVLDELATIGYLTHPRHKKQAVWLIKQNLKDYNLPARPTKADFTILGMQSLAKVSDVNLDRHLSGLATLAEKALTELHAQFADLNP